MSKEGGSILIIFLVLIAAVAGVYFWGVGVYNSAVELQESINQSWSDVQATYQRRADLVPNLVKTVKGAAENEQSILLKVTQARAGIVNAKTPEDLELAGKEINTAINLAFEAYPQIRSTENFLDLQSQLEGTENRINVARQRYNESVAEYNGHVRGYLRKKALGFFGSGEDFSTRTGFTATEGAETVPEVEF
jgi:LemA protein